MFRINKEGLSMISIIEHFLGTTEHFSGKKWSIEVEHSGEQKHNVQRPTLDIVAY